MKWRSDIEGLRGIAVLLVVLYHAGVRQVSGGFIGVDVFFVLSGYLITGLLLDELRSTGRINLIEFYARRARRLVPAALLTVIVTLAVGWLVLPPLTQISALRTGAAAATYWSNLRFALEAGDYFGTDLTRDPLLHMWSLAVEEQFYMVWPLLIAVAALIARSRKAIAGVLVGVTLASFAAALWLTNTASHWAFFGTHARAWEFGVGALAGLIALRLRFAPLFGPVGVLMVLVSGFLLGHEYAWPGTWALLPVVGTAMALMAGAAAPMSHFYRYLSVRPLRELGRLSYTWYLWHWPALILAEATFGPLDLSKRLVVVAAALIGSEITHRLVENPLRFHQRLVSAPRASIGFMVSTGLAVLGAAFFALPGLAAAPQRYLEAMEDLPQSYRDGCHLQVSATAPRLDCVYGEESSQTTVVLFGDSHATQWFPALEEVANERGWRLVVHAKSSCSALTVLAMLPTGQAYEECNTWREAVMQILEREHPELVVLANSAGTVTQTPVALAEGLRTTFERLAPAVGAVLYVIDNPAPGFDAPACLAADGPDECTFELEEALRRHAWQQEAIEGMPIATLDVTDRICAGPECRVQRGSMVTFRDSHHLAASFVATLAPNFDAALAPLVDRVVVP